MHAVSLSRLLLSSTPKPIIQNSSSLKNRCNIICSLLSTMQSSNDAAAAAKNDLNNFKLDLAKARRVLILTGAGVSAESGVPTFRGPDGFWGKYDVTQLTTPGAFVQNPALVWLFYAYRRQLVNVIKPNPAHFAIAELERRMKTEGKHVVVVTQNIDGLHQQAGSQDVVELHGSLFKTRCTKCGTEETNREIPICEALRDARIPEPGEQVTLDVRLLPHCKQCTHADNLLRPAIVWFGEMLDDKIIQRALHECDTCDLCLIVGTSSVVYPAAQFAPLVAGRGVPVAEFNLDKTAWSYFFKYHFSGPAGVNLPPALNLSSSSSRSEQFLDKEQKLDDGIAR